MLHRAIRARPIRPPRPTPHRSLFDQGLGDLSPRTRCARSHNVPFFYSDNRCPRSSLRCPRTYAGRINIRVVGVREKRPSPTENTASTPPPYRTTSTRAASTALLTAEAPALPTATTATECESWQCECQGFSDAFGTGHNIGWGRSQDTQRRWWIDHNCETYPRAGGTLRPAITTPPWSTPIFDLPYGFKDQPAAVLPAAFWTAAIENCTTWGLNRGYVHVAWVTLQLHARTV